MKSERITVLSDIAQLMIDLQMKHSLPVNIIVGQSMIDENGDEQQVLLCEYELQDYHSFAWLVEKTIFIYTSKLNKISEENIKKEGVQNEED